MARAALGRQNEMDGLGASTMSNEAKRAFPRLTQLDGLRAAAVLFVVLHHIYLNWGSSLGMLRVPAEYSWMGVDIFFVLSGFLITGILLRTEPSWIGIRHFYIKRALRIWPLYFILLGAVCCEARLLHKSYPWPISLVLLQNFLGNWPGLGFNQTWSLCIEEHFYLVWPLLIFFAPRRLLPILLCFLFALSPFLRHEAITHGVSIKLLYTSTQYRLDPIVLGSLLAYSLDAKWWNPETAARVSRFILPIGLAAVIATIALNPSELGQRSALLYTYISASSAAVLALVANSREGLLYRALTNRVARYVGRISYGLYMIHPLAFGIVTRIHLPTPLAICLAISLSFAAATLSWHFMESRLLRLKERVVR